jgi:hypothetical protein
VAFRPVVPTAVVMVIAGSTAVVVVESAGSAMVPARSATVVTVPSLPAAVPSGSTCSAEVVVAAAPVPVVAPPWIPEFPWAPLRERTRLRLSVGRDTQTGKSQTGGDGGCCCDHA